MSFSKSIINGNLTKKPTVADGGKYGFMTIAVQRNYKNKEGNYDTDFINVMIAGAKLVDFYTTYFDKGDGVLVEAEVSTRPNKYDKEGKAVELTLITRVFPSFAVGKRSKGSLSEATTGSTTLDDEFETSDDADEDLPF